VKEDGDMNVICLGSRATGFSLPMKLIHAFLVGRSPADREVGVVEKK